MLGKTAFLTSRLFKITFALGDITALHCFSKFDFSILTMDLDRPVELEIRNLDDEEQRWAPCHDFTENQQLDKCGRVHMVSSKEEIDLLLAQMFHYRMKLKTMCEKGISEDLDKPKMLESKSLKNENQTETVKTDKAPLWNGPDTQTVKVVEQTTTQKPIAKQPKSQQKAKSSHENTKKDIVVPDDEDDEDERDDESHQFWNSATTDLHYQRLSKLQISSIQLKYH